MPAGALVIAADNLMPGMRDRLTQGGVTGEPRTFSDTEPIQALQAILSTRPPLVVLERLFAATPRGAALINRIKSDPQLAVCEIQVMSHTGDYVRQVKAPTAAPAPVLATGDDSPPPPEPVSVPRAVTEAARPLDWHGTRRAPRYRVRSGIEILLDGNAANIIDLSAVGAQVISPTVLRPNQKLRISLPTQEFMMRFRGAVAWAKFELPRPPATAPQYRAGIEFADSDSAAIESFSEKNRE